MIVFPNAKINLGLFVTERRNDSYHNLETIFYPVKVEDVLEIVEADKLSINLSGLIIDGDTSNNLSWKAFELLQKDFPDKVKPVAVYLHKAIPMGAGMGGGSADGAFMLQLLNDFFELNIPEAVLMKYALLLGSDCPFFIFNKPCFASGRGEILEPVTLDLTGYTIQLICPQLHIRTADAFKNIQPRKAPFNLKEIATLNVEAWHNHIFNDFEITVFKVHPGLAAIKEQFYQQGALYASMSGTGSAIFGIFPKGKKAVIATDLAFAEFAY